MTQATVFKTVMARVDSASVATKTIQGDSRDVWDLRILVEGLSQYNFPCTMPLEAAEIVKKGEMVPVILRKGRIKKDEYDGTKDYHWYWEIEEWNTGQTPDPNAFSGGAGATGASARSTPSRSNGQGGAEPDERFRTKEELRLTAAYQIAASMAGPMGYKDINDLIGDAEILYTQLSAVTELAEMPIGEPHAALDTPQGSTGPVPDRACPYHQVPYDKRSTTTGKQFHLYDSPAGQYYCIEGEANMVLTGDPA